MKKIFTCILAAMLAMPLFATVLLTESFDYTVGSYLAGERLSSNMPTSDVAYWYRNNTSGISAEMQVIDDNLTYPSYCTNATGHAVKISARHYNEYRQFTQQTSGTVYLSALVKINSFSGTTDDVILAMTPRSYLSKLYARLHCVKTDNGFKFGIAKYSESATWINYTEEYELEKTYLVVLGYTFNANTKDDDAFLYVNPISSTSTPTINCIQSIFNSNNIQQGASKADDASGLGVVIINQTVNTPRDMIIDEIRVFTDWNDISLPTGSDDPVEPTPTLSVTKSAIDFGKFIKGGTYEQTFKVTAENLKDDITITSSNTNAVLVSPATITKDNADLAGDGVVVTASINPERQFTFDVNITVASTDAESKVITAKGTELIVENINVTTLGFFNTTAKNYNPSAHHNVEFEDVIFTYDGDNAKIFTYDDVMKRITITDGSVDDNSNTIQLFVYISDDDWENLPIAQGNKIKELVFTATMQNNPFTGKTTYTATPSKLEFVTVDDTRNITSANIGTICLPGKVKNINEIPATFYKILYKQEYQGEVYNIVLEEVTTLEAGVPYIFEPDAESGELHFLYREQVVYTPQNDGANGLIGTFTKIESAVDNVLVGKYLIANNMFCKAGEYCSLAANRAYIDIDQVPTEENAAPKVGMRHINLQNADARQLPTNLNETQTHNSVRKAIINGQFVILHNNKAFNAIGAEIQ